MLGAFLAHSAQVKPLPSRRLTLPTLFRNRVPETGRAAGREARSVPVSFPFESPCGISFHTARKSERKTAGCRLLRGASPTRGWRQAAPGRRSQRGGEREEGVRSHRCTLPLNPAANSAVPGTVRGASRLLSNSQSCTADGGADAQRWGSLLKVTQLEFKATIGVNPAPASFV